MKFRVFLFVLLSVANAFASDLDFTLVNQTSRSFEGLYITASDNKDWDANLLLNGKVLAAAGKIHVRFKNDAESETCDFARSDRCSHFPHARERVGGRWGVWVSSGRRLTLGAQIACKMPSRH